MSTQRLAGKVAVVTGGARGLGASFATAMRADAATVVTCDVRDGADETIDVSHAHQVRQFVDGVRHAHGRIDVAVANAGVVRITSPVDPWDKAIADFDAVVGSNLRGVYLLGRAVAPLMVEQGGGDIVIVATDHILPPPGRPTGAPSGPTMDIYDASKWALRGLLEAWSRWLAPHGVRVNMLCMDATDTPMIREVVGDRLTDEMVARWMRPEHIAEVLVQLLAEGPDGRTGDSLGFWVGHPIHLPPRTA